MHIRVNGLQFFRPAPFPRPVVLLPLLATEVRAGFPSPADDHIEGEFDLNELLISNPPSTFLLRAAGLSMTAGAGTTGGKMEIYDGDLLIVDRSIKPRDGHIVVACLDGDFTIKQLRRQGERMWLQPANDAFACIPITCDHDFQVWGVVKSKVTEFKV